MMPWAASSFPKFSHFDKTPFLCANSARSFAHCSGSLFPFDFDSFVSPSATVLGGCTAVFASSSSTLWASGVVLRLLERVRLLTLFGVWTASGLGAASAAELGDEVEGFGRADQHFRHDTTRFWQWRSRLHSLQDLHCHIRGIAEYAHAKDDHSTRTA